MHNMTELLVQVPWLAGGRTEILPPEAERAHLTPHLTFFSRAKLDLNKKSIVVSWATSLILH